MKKWLAGFVILLLLCVISLYVLFPQQLPVSTVTSLNASLDGTFRYMSSGRHWTGTDSTSFHATCKTYQFTLGEVKYNTLDVNASRNQNSSSIPTRMVFLELGRDSILIQWKTTFDAGSNPLKRMKNYFDAVALKECMDTTMAKARKQSERLENVYGVDIQYTTLKDSTLVSSRNNYPTYPATDQIYSEIKKLQSYIASQNAKETNSPMLNIIRNNDSSYTLMVAIPTDRELKGTKSIYLKRLLQIPNKTLTTTITGGPAKVEAGLVAIETFMNDHRLSAPVYPFQLLLTDRTTEPDSTKWKTQIFYPIM